VTLSTIGTLLAVRVLYRQLRATRHLQRLVLASQVTTDVDLARLAEQRRLRVQVVDASEPYSLTYGWLAPRVVVSRGLLDSVEPDELDAVLVHERYHVRNLDPLKIVIARTLPVAFFFLTVLMLLGLISTSAWISQSDVVHHGMTASAIGVAGSLLCAAPWIVGILAVQRRRRRL